MLYKTVYVIASGGGSQAISNILTAGGASSYFAGAEIPYSQTQTLDVVGGELWDPKLVSERAAHQMAAAAFTRARKCGGNPIGIGLTASLCKVEKEREGRINQVYLAVMVNAKNAFTIHIKFADYQKQRWYQESVCAELIHRVVMMDFTEYEFAQMSALYSNVKRYIVADTIKHQMYHQSRVVPIMPGSFNPMHAAHHEMYDYIWQKFDTQPILDIGLMHKFKNNISPFEYELRKKAIRSYRSAIDVSINPSWNPLMIDKHYLYKEMYPDQDIVFVMGADTYEKVSDDDRGTIKAIVFPREGFETPNHPNCVVHETQPTTISSTELRNGIR